MRFFVLALCVVLAAAQDIVQPRLFFTVPKNQANQLASNPIVCRKGTTLVNKANYYPATTQFQTQVCQAKYETACATAYGVVLCNEQDAICKDTERTVDADINPILAANMLAGVRPQECASAGIYIHPEAWIIAPAQTVVAFVVLLVAAVLAFLATKGRVDLVVVVTFWLIIVTCILLLVSFYYLNAFVGTMAAIIALSAYATKDTSAVPIGMLAAALAIMWFTFDGGLGYYQHHSRLYDPNARDAALPFMQVQCNNYYRFAMDTPNELSNDATNSAITADGICHRNWLAAEYFFVILLKILLAVLIAAGGSALLPAAPVVAAPREAEIKSF